MTRSMGDGRLGDMVGSQRIAITVRYEPPASYGTSLAWIAPELREAGMALIEDRLAGPIPSRTWAGSVDERTFKAFAKSWALPRQNEGGSAATADDSNDSAGFERTYDGMNWEVGGESPIISVSVHVGPVARVPMSNESRERADRQPATPLSTTLPSTWCPASAFKLSRRRVDALASAVPAYAALEPARYARPPGSRLGSNRALR
jgi:hypothetical protein